MLQPKVLPNVIGQANTDGVKTTLLLNTKGDVLASSGVTKDDKLIAAIAANIWSSYHKTARRAFSALDSEEEELKCLLLDCEQGRLAISNVYNNPELQQVIVCMCAEQTVEWGVLKKKAQVVSKYLKEPFQTILGGN